MRRSSRPSVDDQDEKLILDDDEQDEIVNQIKLEASKQNYKIRVSFTILFLIILIIFAALESGTLYNVYVMNSSNPFMHQVLLSNTSMSQFMLYYLAVIINIAVACKITWQGKRCLPPGVLIASGITSFVICMAWSISFYRLRVTNLALYWLPGTAPFCFFLALYVDYDINGLNSDISHLDSLKYDSIKSA